MQSRSRLLPTAASPLRHGATQPPRASPLVGQPLRAPGRPGRASSLRGPLRRTGRRRPAGLGFQGSDSTSSSGSQRTPAPTWLTQSRLQRVAVRRNTEASSQSLPCRYQPIYRCSARSNFFHNSCSFSFHFIFSVFLFFIFYFLVFYLLTKNAGGTRTVQNGSRSDLGFNRAERLRRFRPGCQPCRTRIV